MEQATVGISYHLRAENKGKRFELIQLRSLSDFSELGPHSSGWGAPGWSWGSTWSTVRLRSRIVVKTAHWSQQLLLEQTVAAGQLLGRSRKKTGRNVSLPPTPSGSQSASSTLSLAEPNREPAGKREMRSIGSQALHTVEGHDGRTEI